MDYYGTNVPGQYYQQGYVDGARVPGTPSKYHVRLRLTSRNS
jgi:hypothetical protein